MMTCQATVAKTEPDGGPARAVARTTAFVLGPVLLAELHVAPAEVPELLSLLRARIRRLSHLDDAGPAEYDQVHRLARFCFSLSSSVRPDGSAIVPSLSSEDVSALYVLPFGRGSAEGVLSALNSVRDSVASFPSDPEVSDRAGKSLLEVMES